MADLNAIETKVQNIIDILTCDTSTGTLPLTFTAKVGNAINWTIYGNAEGVGERTKNLISVNSITADTGVTIVDADEATNSINLSSSVQYRGGRFDFNFEDGKTYTISVVNNESTSNARMAFRQVGTNAIVSSVSLNTAGVKTVTLAFSSTDYPNGVYVSFICNMKNDGETRTISLSKLMLIEGEIMPYFSPYGYQIPITVSQTGQPTKNYEIFVGDTPLGAGETVSKSSTGIDIELFEGENTVSTTLDNKPNMTIKYKK